MENAMLKFDKKSFVENHLSETVAIATPWVKRLEYQSEKEIVVIVCNNDYTYRVNVACDNPAAIIYDVMQEVLRH